MQDCNNLDAKYIEISAKTGESIEKAFRLLAEECKRNKDIIKYSLKSLITNGCIVSFIVFQIIFSLFFFCFKRFIVFFFTNEHSWCQANNFFRIFVWSNFFFDKQSISNSFHDIKIQNNSKVHFYQHCSGMIYKPLHYLQQASLWLLKEFLFVDLVFSSH